MFLFFSSYNAPSSFGASSLRQKPSVSEKMQVKIDEGNSSALWVLCMCEVALELGIPFWVSF